LNLLAFDTSTETMSIAVRGGSLGEGAVLEHVGAGGAQASAALIPAIMNLLAQAQLELGQLDAVVFGRGPGSFTGLRTACAVAQGLAFGADVKVLPLDTLLAVADEANHAAGVTRIVALLDARMDEVYAGAYVLDGAAWRREGEFTLGKPESVRIEPGWALAGNAFGAYGERLVRHAGQQRIEALPTARALLRLAPQALAAGRAVAAHDAMPLYIRDKVAQTTAERAAAKQDPSPAP
jgi:tRNA threonylcarbamoyladenosine biosynthesis protein TsaB